MTTLWTPADLAEHCDPQPRAYADDPVGWVTHQARAETWSKQREMLESIVEHPRTAVRSCHESGKSWAAGQAGAWWIDSHTLGEALVVTTADTFTQVKAVMWQEIGKAARRANVPGRVLQHEWWWGDILVGIGRKPADTDPTALQGLHRRYVLVIVDESDGVPAQMWEAVHSLGSAENARTLALGNPVDPNSHFAAMCRPGSGWYVITIDAFETPNFTDEPVSARLREVLVSRRYVEEVAQEFGEGSPQWQGRVRGIHPEDATDTVCRISTVRANQHLREGVPIPAEELWTDEELEPRELGVDVGASAGGDRSVIYARFGVRFRRVWGGQTPDEDDLAERIVDAVVATKASKVKIDATGVGWAVAGLIRAKCRERGIKAPAIVKVMVGEASTKPKRFARLRDQIWWEVGRELNEDGGWDLSEVDEQTVAQLTAVRYSTNTARRIVIEKKAETKERIGRSPDDADAILLAAADVGEGAAWMEAWRRMSEPDEVKPSEPTMGPEQLKKPVGRRRGCHHEWSPSRRCIHCGIHHDDA